MVVRPFSCDDLGCAVPWLQVVMDMTFGAGGHTKAILRAVPDVTVVALDRDPLAYQLAQQLAEEHP